MKNIICLGLILFSGLVSAAPATDAPKITFPKGARLGEVDLGIAARSALFAYASDFELLRADQFIASVQDLYDRTPNETPMAVVGDFNGDKKNDIAVMGKSHNELLVLAIVSGPKGYGVKEISRAVWEDPEKTFFPPVDENSDAETDEEIASVPREQGLFRYLALYVGGTSLDGSGKYVLKNDAFTIEPYFSKPTVYYMKDGEFQIFNPHKKKKP